MSYEQLTNRLQSLQKQQRDFNRELQELLGARRELGFIMSQMVPGLDHEALAEREKKIDVAVNQTHNQLQQCSGAIKETAHWLQQTPEGQKPSEAIQQLINETKSSSSESFETEGPRSEFQALLSHEYQAAAPALNGAEPVEALRE